MGGRNTKGSVVLIYLSNYVVLRMEKEMEMEMINLRNECLGHVGSIDGFGLVFSSDFIF